MLKGSSHASVLGEGLAEPAWAIVALIGLSARMRFESSALEDMLSTQELQYPCIHHGVSRCDPAKPGRRPRAQQLIRGQAPGFMREVAVRTGVAVETRSWTSQHTTGYEAVRATDASARVRDARELNSKKTTQGRFSRSCWPQVRLIRFR